MVTMRRYGAAAAAATTAAALVIACGGSKSSETGLAAASPSPSPTPYSENELKARVLGLTDMPSGYTVDTQSSSSSSGTDTVTASDPNCQPLLDLSKKGKPPEEIARAESQQFDASDNGPFVQSYLASFPTAASAQAYLDKFTKAVQSCTKFTETEQDGTKLDLTVSVLSVPAVGEASSGTRLGFSVQNTPVVSDLVISRIGSTLVALQNTAVQQTDATLTRSLIDKAIAKLQNPEAATTSPSASNTSARA